jgi:uncharacterized protein
MKLLLFSDLHGDVASAGRLAALSQGVDVVVGAGDFGNIRRGVSACIEVLKAIHCPAILVPGNNESMEELTDACRVWPEAHILHGAGVTIAGISFYGIGGGIPVTPFGAWSYDFTEEQAAVLLADCPPGCVLISHSPPKGSVDVSSGGQSLGSIAVRGTILRVQPLLVVCGHIHASAGKQARIGRTAVVNVGPQGIEWEL